jgi:hypothetical protein
MALVLIGKTTCPLCHLIIGQDDQIVCTTRFIAVAIAYAWRSLFT